MWKNLIKLILNLIKSRITVNVVHKNQLVDFKNSSLFLSRCANNAVKSNTNQDWG